METWVFDMDETIVSSTLPYYFQHGFGAEPYNPVAFNAWVEKGEALVLPESHKLGEKDMGKPSVAFKSEKRMQLEKEGYKIVGNIGDQWSDILGSSTGDRTFKLPNPMYYIP